MTNSAIITKIEYKYQESDAWTEIAFIAETANFSETTENTRAGILFNSSVTFKISKNQNSTTEPISSILRRKAIFRLTDGNKVTYTIGTDEFKANLFFTKKADGLAGSFNGRLIEISCISPYETVII